LVARPYIRRELPGWGKLSWLYDYKSDWLWAGSKEKVIVGKLHGYSMTLDLSQWSARATYFLERWNNLEVQMLAKVALKPGDTVIDVGANTGMFTLLAARLVRPGGRVISFEPNLECYDALIRSLARNKINNVDLRPIGLGEVECEATLTIPKFNSGEGTFGQTIYTSESTKAVTRPISTGDIQLKAAKASLIKIDVEGFECRVLVGLTSVLSRDHPIIITEIVKRQLQACGSSVSELCAILTNLGYAGYRMKLLREKRYTEGHLIPFSDSDDLYDAIWLHPLNIRANADLPLNFHPAAVRV
jgi:FkbM family methyltransferase